MDPEDSASKPKRLPEKWSLFLSEKPETGMDYHTGDVVLKNGTTIHDVAFVGSTWIGEVRGQYDIPFDPEDIVEIQLTHKRWKFTR